MILEKHSKLLNLYRWKFNLDKNGKSKLSSIYLKFIKLYIDKNFNERKKNNKSNFDW